MISGPKFTELFHSTREELWYKTSQSDFEYLHQFRRYSPSNFEVVRNWAKFCMFFAPKNFLGGPPETLSQDYKTEHSSEHHAKFRDDRPMELGDFTRKKIKAVKNKKINASKT